MKHFIIEDQYRIVGTNGTTSHVRWVDTVQEAIEHALTYDTAVVYRPNGTLVGEYFGRRMQDRLASQGK